MSDIHAWRKVAEAATPGVWTALVDGVYVDPQWTDEGWLTYEAEIVELESEDDEPHPDAAHIATFDPPTIFSILDRLEAAAAKVARVEALAAEWDADAVEWVDSNGPSPGEQLRAALDGAP